MCLPGKKEKDGLQIATCAYITYTLYYYIIMQAGKLTVGNIIWIMVQEARKPDPLSKF